MKNDIFKNVLTFTGYSGSQFNRRNVIISFIEFTKVIIPKGLNEIQFPNDIAEITEGEATEEIELVS